MATALAWAELNVPVLPIWPPSLVRDGGCACGDPDCGSPGKHPVGFLAPNGMKDAATDPSTVARWFDTAVPLNVGVRMGRGFVALDLDPRGGADLNDTYDLPETLTERTGNGEHRLYRVPKDARPQTFTLSAGAQLRGIDTYIVTAPSRHALGTSYRWLDPEVPIARFPFDRLGRVRIANRQRGRMVASVIDPGIVDPVAVERAISAMGRLGFGDVHLRAFHGERGLYRDASPSGDDWNLARALTLVTEDDRVVKAALLSSALPRQKWLRDPHYLDRTIAKARAGAPPPSAPTPETNAAPYDSVIYVTSLLGNTLLPGDANKSTRAKAAILEVIARREVVVNGFVAVPVTAIAATLGVHRQTVWRALTDLIAGDVIESYAEPLHTLKGSVQAVRFARLKGH